MNPPLKTAMSEILQPAAPPNKSFEFFINHCQFILSKYPHIEKSFLRELERFFSSSSEEFRKRRSDKTILRLVLSSFFYREKILREIRLSPAKRHLFARLFSSQL